MMKKLIAVAVLVAATVCVIAGQAQTQGGSPEQEVRKLEREWLDAYEQRDAAAMERIVADDFIITFPKGEMQTKAQILEALKAVKAQRVPTAPKPKFYTEDVRARVYGDTVILTGRVITHWQSQGNEMRDQSRYTDTYVKRNGRWQVVASHLSGIELQQPPVP